MNNDDDFYEILGGVRVHDADPKTAKLAGALRGALLARQERPHLAPLRPPPSLSPKRSISTSESRWVPLWWIPATVTASLLVGIAIPILFQQIAPLQESREKSFPTILELKSSVPKNMAQNIQEALQAAGIESTKAQEENLWVLEFQSPINNREIVVEIGFNETKTTP
jgi:hypothetical protein